MRGSLGINMKIKGNAMRELERLPNRIKRGVNTALKKYGDMERMNTRNRIVQRKTGPLGSRWTPWAFSTLQSRIRKGNAAQGLLYDTGDLWRSVNFYVVGNTLHLGSTVDYAKYLQYGTRNMPARPIVGFDKRRVKRDLTKILKKELKL